MKDRASLDLPALPDALEVTPPDASTFDAPPRDAVSEREPGTCATSADCTSDLDRRVCDTATGRCVRCTAAEDTCPAAEHCDEALHACASGCHTDDGCVTMSGQRLRCDRARHLCVACLVSADCPPNTVCVGGNCTPGCDADRGCATGLMCCTRTLACIDTTSNTTHCGACERPCPFGPHASAVCTRGECGLTCETGFGDCDGRADNGCETDLAATIAHCGRCGAACVSGASATATCRAGACVQTCAEGLADCDGRTDNGCEADTRTSVAHCGRCGSGCAPGQRCSAGACVTTCPSGQTTCSTACVNLQTDATHCGMCDRACPSAPNATATCAAGACGLSCEVGRGDCDRDTTNGCETDTRDSITHCGRCGNACATGQVCVAGTCAAPPPVPRPRAPLSSAVVTTRRPTLRWLPDTIGAQVEICRDRACMVRVTTLVGTAGSATPTSDLPTGVLFWRVRGWNGVLAGTATSATWEFWVPSLPRTPVVPPPVATSWDTGLTDVDGDGFGDALLRDGSDRVFVYWGRAGTDGIEAGPMLPRSDFWGPTHIVGDLNGDGFADIMQGWMGGMDVYYGRANRAIRRYDTLPASELASRATNLRRIGDVDGDGFADVLVSAQDNGSGVAYIYYGRALAGGIDGVPPEPWFRSRTRLDAPSGARRFGTTGAEPGDLDGDGFADVVVSAQDSGTSYVYFGAAGGRGAVVTAPDLTLTNAGYYGHGAGDVNGDGYADVILGDASGEVHAYLGRQDRMLLRDRTRLADFPGRAGGPTGEIDAGDLDGDGLGDVFVGSQGSGRTAVYLGNATNFGTSSATWPMLPETVNSHGSSVRVRDLNGDGYSDVLVATGTANRVYIHYGAAGSTRNTPSRQVLPFALVH